MGITGLSTNIGGDSQFVSLERLEAAYGFRLEELSAVIDTFVSGADAHALGTNLGHLDKKSQKKALNYLLDIIDTDHLQTLVRVIKVLKGHVAQKSTLKLGPEDKAVVLHQLLSKETEQVPSKAQEEWPKDSDVERDVLNKLLALFAEGNASIQSKCPVRAQLDGSQCLAYLTEPFGDHQVPPYSGEEAAKRGIKHSDALESANRRTKILSLLLGEPLLNQAARLDVLLEDPSLLGELQQQLNHKIDAIELNEPTYSFTNNHQKFIWERFKQSPMIEQSHYQLNGPRLIRPSVSFNRQNVGVYGVGWAKAMAEACILNEALSDLAPEDPKEFREVWKGLTYDGRYITEEEDEKAKWFTSASLAGGGATVIQMASILLKNGVVEIDDEGNEKLLTNPADFKEALAGLLLRLASIQPDGMVQPSIYKGFSLKEPLIAKRGKNGKVRALKMPTEYTKLLEQAFEKRALTSIHDKTGKIIEGEPAQNGVASMYATETLNGCPMAPTAITQDTEGEYSLAGSPLHAFISSFLELGLHLYTTKYQEQEISVSTTG